MFLLTITVTHQTLQFPYPPKELQEQQHYIFQYEPNVVPFWFIYLLNKVVLVQGHLLHIYKLPYGSIYYNHILVMKIARKNEKRSQIEKKEVGQSWSDQRISWLIEYFILTRKLLWLKNLQRRKFTIKYLLQRNFFVKINLEIYHLQRSKEVINIL